MTCPDNAFCTPDSQAENVQNASLNAVTLGGMTHDDERRAQSARLRDARKARGFATAKLAAEAMGEAPSTYAQYENGTRGFGKTKARKYAARFGVTPEWLLFGNGDKLSQAPILQPIDRAIPVMGEVAAGVWREALSVEVADAVEFLAVDVRGYERASLYALRVVGNSMNKIYGPGRYVIVAPAAEAGIRWGDFVVVERRKSDFVETTVKELVNEGGRIALWPRSTDDAFQTPFYIDGPNSEARIVGVVVADYAKTERPEAIFVPPSSFGWAD